MRLFRLKILRVVLRNPSILLNNDKGDACNHWKRSFAYQDGGFEGMSGKLPGRKEIQQGNDR